MENIILASASPRRRELLEQLGYGFTIIVSSEKEEADKTLSPELYTNELALLKARNVARKLLEENRKNNIIISADTIVYHEGKILEKPKDTADARKMILSLSGKCHEVYTGVCVLRTADGFSVSKSVKTKVFFKKLNEKIVDAYIKTGEPADKAGAYGIQGKGSVLIEKIEGDYFNVVGLPVSTLYDILYSEFNIDIFNMKG